MVFIDQCFANCILMNITILSKVAKLSFVFILILLGIFSLQNCSAELTTYRQAEISYNARWYAMFCDFRFPARGDEYLTEYFKTKNSVRHIAIDINHPDTLIYVDGHALKSTDRRTVSLIAGSENDYGFLNGKGGSARFWYITSFVQLSSRHIVAVDRQNHCLRLIDSLSGDVSTFSGDCQHLGFVDGQQGKYRQPYSIIKDNQDADMLLISDDGNSAIREYDTRLKYVGTFYQNKANLLFKPKVITQQSKTGDIFMTTSSHVIFRLSYERHVLTRLAGSIEGDSDGSFSTARFRFPSAILLLDEGRQLVVADEPQGRLRILGMRTLMTRSVCSKTNGRALGQLDKCGFDNPYCLLVNGSDLLIGDFGRITKIRGEATTLFVSNQFLLVLLVVSNCLLLV